ncbi:MAG: hypothetical protein QM496_21905 [Verrucomicrobiota bacterium]
MNEQKTLLDTIVEMLAFHVTWTPYQLSAIIFWTLVFHFAAFLKWRSFNEGLVIVISACYLVVNQVCWFYYFFSVSWALGEGFSGFEAFSFLPYYSLAFGALALLALLGNAVIISRKRREYGWRRWVAALLACLLLIVVVLVSAATPITFRRDFELEMKKEGNLERQ